MHFYTNLETTLATDLLHRKSVFQARNKKIPTKLGRPSSQRGKVERKNRMEEKIALIGHLKIIALNVAHIATVLWEHS